MTEWMNWTSERALGFAVGGAASFFLAAGVTSSSTAPFALALATITLGVISPKMLPPVPPPPPKDNVK